jgi:hypothetical protein
VDFVSKFVVMEKDTLYHVMMEIMSMVTDVLKIVKFKSVSHVMVDHQALKTAAQQFFLQPFLSKAEDNQDFTEKSFLTSDSTIFQKSSLLQ